MIEHGDEEGIRWRHAILTPGTCAPDVIHGLAGALLSPDGIPELWNDDNSLTELAQDLIEAPRQAAKQVRRSLVRASTDTEAAHLILLVDQFEELFTHPSVTQGAMGPRGP